MAPRIKYQGAIRTLKMSNSKPKHDPYNFWKWPLKTHYHGRFDTQNHFLGISLGKRPCNSASNSSYDQCRHRPVYKWPSGDGAQGSTAPISDSLHEYLNHQIGSFHLYLSLYVTLQFHGAYDKLLISRLKACLVAKLQSKSLRLTED